MPHLTVPKGIGAPTLVDLAEQAVQEVVTATRIVASVSNAACAIKTIHL